MKRQPANLPESLCHRLNSYALAATATGVGALALVHPVEAEIIYTKSHHVIGPRGTYHLSLNHKGIDFVISERGSWHGSYGAASLGVKALGNNAVRGYTFSHFSTADRLNEGSLVSAKGTFVGNKQWALMAAYVCGSACGYEGGPWAFNRSGYLGLKFSIGKQVHYAWARLTVREPGDFTFKATLTGYAYETVPNKPIIAGKTHGKDVVTVQEGGSLGHLAGGSK